MYPNLIKLLEERQKARETRDFQKADEIRYYLERNKIKIEDTKNGPIWKVIVD